MSRYFDDYYSLDSSSLELEHHGIQGQKWGVRRFQNPDGSLTDEGRRRLGYDDNRVFKDEWKQDRVIAKGTKTTRVMKAKARWMDSAKSKEYKKDLNDTGGEEYARKLARTSGLDQGDNWKMYRDALAGDERAQAIVEEWERNKGRADSVDSTIERGRSIINDLFNRDLLKRRTI